MNIEWISGLFSTVWVRTTGSRTDLRSISLPVMEQIFPSPVDDVDAATLYRSDVREADGRPWVMCNMISSTDGAISLDGVSGGLGGPADKVIFSAIRGVPDVIIVASGTVLAENYRTAQTSTQTQQVRIASGQWPIPRIAIVTQSLRIDPTHRVFAGDVRPIVITSGTSPEDSRTALSAVADIVIAGETTVDLRVALDELQTIGAETVLLEGGPTLNGAFVDDDLIDELCLSFAPMMLGGDSSRIVARSTNTVPHPMRLDRVLHEDGYLFHRYLRQR